eukprot:TRINITY_DN5496_c0_g1_i1.p1 TRINITY_DN5496_c0_g1~~TRINITY_DN5496_c0_g1_i1.p1  ORF type:complete len:1067 (-),score=461.99 TRINITY_DN5496_c0_g1_i1:270-3470(-)
MATGRVQMVEKLRSMGVLGEGDPEQIFHLIEELASGSFGIVYKAKHNENGKNYAVKIITPEADENFEEFLVEINILRKCQHETIVGFFGAWVKGEEIFIAMELCDGGAVGDIYNVCNEAMGEDQIAAIARETLRGLSYLHSKSIIHRDIKSANILLTGDGDIKLVDFGVSAVRRDANERRYTMIGTPYWMAPEIIANKTGHEPYDQKCDVWSLGITMLELAEMNPPLHEIHPMKALMMIPMRDPPTFQQPDKWTRDFKDFVNQCLVKDPAHRKNCDELLVHPFVASVKPRPPLLELLAKRRRLEASDAPDEATDGDDLDDLSDSSESESEEEERLVKGVFTAESDDESSAGDLAASSASDVSASSLSDSNRKRSNSPAIAVADQVSKAPSKAFLTSSTDSPDSSKAHKVKSPAPSGASLSSSPANPLSPLQSSVDLKSPKDAARTPARGNETANPLFAASPSDDKPPSRAATPADSAAKKPGAAATPASREGPASPSRTPLAANHPIDGTTAAQRATQRRQARRASSRALIEQLHPDRPTYRTNRKMTRRDITAKERQFKNGSMLKRNLKQIRDLQALHARDKERQALKHQQTVDSCVAKFKDMEAKRLRQQAGDLDRLQRDQKDRLDELRRAQQVESKNQLKLHQGDLKQSIKVQQNDVKNEQKAYRDQSKKSFKDKQKATEADKSLAKADIKALKVKREIEMDWLDLLFGQKQAKQSQSHEFDTRRQQLDEVAKNERRLCEIRHRTETENMWQQHGNQMSNLMSNRTFALDTLSQTQPVEMKTLLEKQELERSHLLKQQELEYQQQQSLLVTELKEKTREKNKRQKGYQDEAITQIKALPKQHKDWTKKQLKDMEQEIKKAVVSRMQKEDAEHAKKQAKQRQEEEEMLSKYQKSKQLQQKDEQGSRIRKLQEEQEQQRRKTVDDFAQQEAALRERLAAQQNDLVTVHHRELQTLQQQHFKSLELFFIEYQSEQSRLLETQHKEQVDFKKKHKLDADVAQLLRDQEEEMRLYKGRQTKERDSLHRQNDIDAAELSQQLDVQKAKLLVTPATVALGGFAADASGLP